MQFALTEPCNHGEIVDGELNIVNDTIALSGHSDDIIRLKITSCDVGPVLVVLYLILLVKGILGENEILRGGRQRNHLWNRLKL